jgi:O-6-methylguanine DNA methyltransferase
MNSPNPPFAPRVTAMVRRIPRGSVMTYAEVARRAGRPNACRAVGNILNKNRDPKVPCHRVVRSDGTPGGYAWGTRRKIARLRHEGVRIAFKGGKHVILLP